MNILRGFVFVLFQFLEMLFFDVNFVHLTSEIFPWSHRAIKQD